VAETLIAEREIPLAMEGIDIGKVKVKVFEGPPIHVNTQGVNASFLIARAVFHGKEYEVMSNRGSVEGAVEDLKKKILSDLRR